MSRKLEKQRSSRLWRPLQPAWICCRLGIHSQDCHPPRPEHHNVLDRSHWHIHWPHVTQLQSSIADTVVWYYILSRWFLRVCSSVSAHWLQSSSHYSTSIPTAWMQDYRYASWLFQTPTLHFSSAIWLAKHDHCHPERTITQPYTASFSSLPHFLCWNHVLHDCKRWCLHLTRGQLLLGQHSHCYPAARICLQFYKAALLVAIIKWIQAFSQYFMYSTHPITKHLGAWQLCLLGVDQHTGNQLETFNNVMKKLQQWKDAPVDSLTLCLF